MTMTVPKTETEQLFGDLDRPSLVGLSYILRHPDTWPKGFKWNYDNCTACAIGLAHRLWKDDIGPLRGFNADWCAGASIMARELAMPFAKALQIFYYANERERTRKKCFGLISIVDTVCIEREAVTPEMVADDIDSFLAGQRG